MARIRALIPVPVEVQFQAGNVRGQRLHVAAGGRQLARQQGISMEEARRQVAENLEEYRAVRSILEEEGGE